jgi:flavodoxin
MRKLPAVEQARAVMTEGMEWGLWRWLLEKGRVQEIADRATAALAEADRKVKATWSDDLKTAYKELVDREKPKRARHQEEDPKTETPNLAPEVRLTARKVKEAYDEGQRARVEAEDTFEEAERRMSTDLAREGARKALKSYDLREHAIRKAEAAARPTSGGKA